jgi:hypothetical protein
VWLIAIGAPICWMSGSKSIRNENLDGATQQFGARVSKKRFDLRICLYDVPFVIDHHDGIGRTRKQFLEKGLGI